LVLPPGPPSSAAVAIIPTCPGEGLIVPVVVIDTVPPTPPTPPFPPVPPFVPIPPVPPLAEPPFAIILGVPLLPVTVPLFENVTVVRLQENLCYKGSIDKEYYG
jgi:hypothetical protein